MRISFMCGLLLTIDCGQHLQSGTSRCRGEGESIPLFRVIKRQFGYTKVRYRGLMKNTAQQTTLFALSNLWMMRKRLLVAGEVRL